MLSMFSEKNYCFTIKNFLEMKKLEKNAKVVSLISYISLWGEKVDSADYNNPRITEVRPAIVSEDGKYTDLRTGEVIERTPSMLEWLLFPGNVVEYPDGKLFLISRLADKERTRVIFAEDEGNWRYSPTSMVKIEAFKREVKKENLY